MKTIDKLLQGCDHDGSMIPVNEVKRLMEEYAQQAISEREASQWKSYPENKPENMTLHIVSTSDDIVIEAAYNNGWFTDIRELKNVIAFRSLPEPYRK